MTTSQKHYSKVAVILHWLIAAAIVFQLALGWRMGEEPKGPGLYALFQLHKSIGFTILFLSLFRLGWRLTHVAPPLPAGMPRWEQLAAKLTHLAFYGIMIGLPLSGWLLVSTSKINIPTLLFGQVPMPHLPWFVSLAADAKSGWHELAEDGHGLLAFATAGLLALHLGAVLKHQVLEKDEVFAHMAVGARPGLLEWRLWAAFAALPLVAAAAWFYHPAVTVAKPMEPVMSEPVLAENETTNAESIAEDTGAPAVAAEPAANAAADAPAAVKAEPALAVPWQVSAKSSSLGFATSWSGEAVLGHFKNWQADIVFGADELDKSSIKVTVDLASVSTGDEQRDSALPGDDWFDAGHHPQAVFVSKKIRKTGKRYQAEGALTLRDKTEPVTLTFDLSVDGDKASARGFATLDRTVFGVGQGEYAATDSIPAAVKVTFNLKANRKTAN
jgi:cytochrome b561/polyisoprenoid-binding protein YceI